MNSLDTAKMVARTSLTYGDQSDRGRALIALLKHSEELEAFKRGITDVVAPNVTDVQRHAVETKNEGVSADAMYEATFGGLGEINQRLERTIDDLRAQEAALGARLNSANSSVLLLNKRNTELLREIDQLRRLIVQEKAAPAMPELTDEMIRAALNAPFWISQRDCIVAMYEAMRKAFEAQG